VSTRPEASTLAWVSIRPERLGGVVEQALKRGREAAVRVARAQRVDVRHLLDLERVFQGYLVCQR
jgi:hypothetical protein